MSKLWSLNKYLIPLSPLVVTIVIIPFSFDPINAPKLFALVTSVMLMVSIGVLSRIRWKPLDIVDLVIFVFGFLVLANLFLNRNAFSERFFGVHGRLIGAVTWISFVTLLFVSKRSNFRVLHVLQCLFLANLLVCAYFVFQKLKIDFGDYSDLYSAPSSTLGNPNFVSGFVGFSCIAIFGIVAISSKRCLPLILSAFSFPLNLWVIWKSESTQGFVSLIGSLSLFSFALAYSHISRKILLIVVLLLVPTLAIVSSGFFGYGPFSTILSSSTTFSRLDYWRAAISMAVQNPLFGKGIDAFGDFYRFYRDAEAFNRFGESQVTNSAHNVYLDVFATGGMPLGISFILLNILPLLYAMRRINLSPGTTFDWSLISLISLWFGFQIQTLVSPNQIGISIWIWILLAAMCHPVDSSFKNCSISRNKSSLKIRVSISAVSLIVATGASYASYLPLQKNIDFLNAAKKSDGLKLKEIIEKFPQDTFFFLAVAEAFQNAGYERQSLALLKVGLSHNEDSFQLWKKVIDHPLTTRSEKLNAQVKLSKLDPRYKLTGP